MINPLKQKLQDHVLVLGSGSPRRKMFLEELDLEFEVRTKSVEETYPPHLKGKEISEYLAKLKAEAFKDIGPKEIVITADTVVWHNNVSLAKADNKSEALYMLQQLSGDWHQVITSVCFASKAKQRTVSAITEVKFKEFTPVEMEFYIENFKPFDKAGAYGIQEWIGMTGISEIRGSYTNVVGLPTHLVYETLMDMVS